MRKKVGLALGSGGAKGGAHIGIIKVLLENHIPIDYIAGSSAGAVVGAYLALYGNVEKLEEILLKFGKRDMLDIIDLNDPRKSLLRGDKVRDFIDKRFYQMKDFKDTKIPLGLTATILEDGSGYVFKKGNLAFAVRASGSLPGVFLPVEYKGKHLIDGGAVDPVPVDVVKQMGADVVIAVDLTGFEKGKIEDMSARNVLERSYRIIFTRLSEAHRKMLGKDVVMLNPFSDAKTSMVNPVAFYEAKNYIKLGEEAARKALPRIRKLVRG